MTRRFITIEGIEGAGKTTCLNAIREAFDRAGITDPLFTREPGGTPFAEALRTVLLDAQHDGVSAAAETLTLFAARADHLERVIAPALAAGRWVVCDRFTDATYAYQGGGRGLDADRIATLETWVHGGFAAQRTLLLDVEPTIGKARVASRGRATDRFEQEREAFFMAARSMYRARAAAEPDRFRIIDANQPAVQVAEQVRNTISELIHPVNDRNNHE